MIEIELVKQFYKHLSVGDMLAAYSLLNEDFTLKQATSLPYGGVYIGSKGLDDFFLKFFSFWKSFETISTDYYLSGTKVFAISQVHGVIRKSDRIVKTEMVQVYEVKHQRLTSAQPFYFDTKVIGN